MPWLNRFDAAWLASEIGDASSTSSSSKITRRSEGSATRLRAALGGRALTVFGVEGWPACGTPDEALRFHGLDGDSLAARIARTRRVCVPAR